MKRSGQLRDGLVKKFGRHGRLLDDFRDDDHVIALGWGILERMLDRETGAGEVVSPDVENRRGMRSRLNVAHVHFFQLFDMVQHVGKLMGEFHLFLWREREASELGNVVDVEVGGLGHGRQADVYAEAPPQNQRANPVAGRRHQATV
jgi:hypothetical protein